MGCYSFTSYNVVSGLIIPDQELIINQTEVAHPFASIEVSVLFSEFSRRGLVGAVKRSEFFGWCSSIGVEPKQLKEKFGGYLDQLKTPDNKIDIHQLLVTSILLSRGHFFNKIKRLLKLYSLSNLHITQMGLTNMLEDLVHASTVILPSMSKGKMPCLLYTSPSPRDS